MGLQRLGFKSLTYHPDGDFRLHDDSQGAGPYIAEWRSSSDRPTVADIEAAHNEGAAHHASQEYARKRKAEYPSIDELVVALWEGVVEERMAAVTSLEGKRQAVKTKYPKG